MVSFENYQGSGNNKTLLYVFYAVVAALVFYLIYLAYTSDTSSDIWTGFGPEMPPAHADADLNSQPKAPKSGAKVDAGTGDGYGYDSGDFDYAHAAHIGVDGVEGRDPSNSTQKYTSYVSPLDGKTYYDPVVMHNPQDYLTEDEFDHIVDRHTLGYNKCRLDWLTTPSYLRNGDMWFGTVWPNDNKAPLSNLRGACVNADDIVHHGIFRSNGKFGEHPACEDKGCVY